MAATDFPLNDALAVKRWSTSLDVEAAKKAYFPKFMGTGTDSVICIKNELNKAAGEKITVALRAKLEDNGIEGDNIIEGHATGEEALAFFNDSLYIDQLRKSTKSKGKMSEQRVPYNMRKEGRDALSTWWAEYMDEQIMMYLAGARGIDTSFKVPLTWTGRANNTLVAPDTLHQIYAGNATGKADLATDDIVGLVDIERLVATAETLDPMIQGLNIGGERKFVFLMHPYQSFQLRTSTTTNDWLDIQKAAGSRGSNIVYKNSLGEYADVILHKHRNVIRFNDYGGASVPAARALFLGAQAGLMAYGQNASPQRYSWNEDKDDRGNALAITAGSIFGTKRTVYDSKTYGLIACDSYCPTPTGVVTA
jgi:N4-gp56 family major capsid protein